MARYETTENIIKNIINRIIFLNKYSDESINILIGFKLENTRKYFAERFNDMLGLLYSYGVEIRYHNNYSKITIKYKDVCNNINILCINEHILRGMHFDKAYVYINHIECLPLSEISGHCKDKEIIIFGD